MNTATAMITAVAPHAQILAAGSMFSSGVDIAYMAEGLLAAVSLVVGTMATLGKASKEGAGAGLTHQILVIALSVVIFLSSGFAALMTHELQSHGVTNRVNVPNPYGQ
jgi:hypothetical protein